MKYWGVLGAGILALAACPARAQTPSPLAEWQYSAGRPLQVMFEPDQPDWQVVAGVAAYAQPLYDGSARTRAQPGISLDLRYRDLAFASLGEGVGVNLLHGSNYHAGIAISYDLGRSESVDRVHLHGLGNVNFAPETKLFADYVISEDFPLVLRANVRRQIGATNGWIGDAGAYMPLPGSGQTFQWFAGPSLTFADDTYMQRYFGVGVAQSARSGLRRYNAAGGLKSVGFGLSANYSLTEHWIVAADAALTQLVGSAADSPITQNATGASVALSLNRKF
jgi:outer membrane scaffolding protein for murein synthesis (MipA/OmpV family)